MPVDILPWLQRTFFREFDFFARSEESRRARGGSFAPRGTACCGAAFRGTLPAMAQRRPRRREGRIFASLPILLATAMLSHGAVAAEPRAAMPLAAQYEVRVAGLTVIRAAALLDLGERAYRVVTRVRATGLAGLFDSGEQVTSAEGRWLGDRPLPRSYRVDGTWRGTRREVALDYVGEGGLPVVRALEPAETGEREPVPEALRRGTTDTLSALAQLARTVAQTGRCEGVAATYDGRRRLDISAQTEGTDLLPPQRGFPGGEALRCVLESRLVAGRRLEDDAARAHRPQRAIAWLAPVGPAGQMVPVRIEAPSRWFGTIRIELVGLEHAASGEARPSACLALEDRETRSCPSLGEAPIGKQALQQPRQR